jgi:hypothetical protein
VRGDFERSVANRLILVMLLAIGGILFGIGRAAASEAIRICVWGLSWFCISIPIGALFGHLSLRRDPPVSVKLPPEAALPL